jgi:nucleoside-diphosphate-sugar epimerase
MQALVTGGAGFFGSLLKRAVLDSGACCTSIDLQPDSSEAIGLTVVQGDIRNRDLLRQVFSARKFDVVFHCAAMLAHEVKSKQDVWSHNVDGTRAIAEMAQEFHVPKVVYTSTNCLWGKPLGRLVREDDEPLPIEIYGSSKWEGEKILLDDSRGFRAVVLRCPTIMDCGRLGLLAILYQFIDEGRKVWLVGGGNNRYQFIYAQDLIEACLRGAKYPGSGVFNIGSDNVKSMREVYQFVIDHAKTGARVASLPKGPTLAAMQLCHLLRVSPLGPYQYKMIAEDFCFDTSKIKSTLEWQPTLTNEQMLLKAYEYYHSNRGEIHSRTDVSAHRKPARMGVINLLRWIS